MFFIFLIMENTNTKSMDLNKETALRLWNKFYGKETKVKDFTGRQIVKGAYNNRNSQFGWNVDHILPQSRGGKTADYNLIICHILTNDEKANKFPVFNANGKKFEILKVENHYEIRSISHISNEEKQNIENDDSINFMDSSAGIKFFKKLKGIQNKSRWVGSVLIRLQNVANTAVIDFIEKFLNEENISYSMSRDYRNSETRIIAKNYDMPLQEDISKLLDKCILLNTYLKYYFEPMDYISKYDICYQINHFVDKEDMYLSAKTTNFDGFNYSLDNALFIDELVYVNTEAIEREPNLSFLNNLYCRYDYTYTNLAKNLKKEASK